MMYLTEVKLADIVKKQFIYKLKAYISVFNSLLIIQVIAMFLSTNGSSGSYGSGSDGISFSFNLYNGDLIIIVSMLWAFISAIIITTKAYRNDDFVFISNRLSSNLSNIFFLKAASIVAGITAMLSGILFKVIIYLTLDDGNVIGTVVSFRDLVVGIIMSILYILLFASLGYLVGMLVQFSKWVSLILLIGLVSYSILGLNQNGEA